MLLQASVLGKPGAIIFSICINFVLFQSFYFVHATPLKKLLLYEKKGKNIACVKETTPFLSSPGNKESVISHFFTFE